MAAKADQAEIEKRINTVYSLILDCYSTNNICRYASEKWGISSRQAERLIKEARDRMIKIASIDNEQAFAEEVEARRQLIKIALAEKRLQTALNAMDSRAKLRGLFNKEDPQNSTEVINIVGSDS